MISNVLSTAINTQCAQIFEPHQEVSSTTFNSLITNDTALNSLIVMRKTFGGMSERNFKLLTQCLGDANAAREFLKDTKEKLQEHEVKDVVAGVAGFYGSVLMHSGMISVKYGNKLFDNMLQGNILGIHGSWITVGLGSTLCIFSGILQATTAVESYAVIEKTADGARLLITRRKDYLIQCAITTRRIVADTRTYTEEKTARFEELEEDAKFTKYVEDLRKHYCGDSKVSFSPADI